MFLENSFFRVHVRKEDGAIDSLYVKKNDCEWIGETRLAQAFRMCVPVEGYQCNYAESSRETAVELSEDGMTITVTKSGILAPMGELDMDLIYTISLEEEAIKFRSSLTNRSPYAVSEFWFPRIGGITQFDKEQNALLAMPEYINNCRHNVNLIKNYPGTRGLGAEAAEWGCCYQGHLVMPWMDIYDAASDTGLYLGYHDTTFRFSFWHTYLYPDRTGVPGRSLFSAEDACGEPAGLEFAHVRFPYIQDGEKFETGEFILRVHEGDWHSGSQYYRAWFMEHFPFDKKDSWLRKKSSWFSSIIYQPEDRVVADYKQYDAWCRDAEKYGIDCHELIGWDKGGLERDYPEYVPEEKLGGREGFRALLKSIHDRGGKCLVFVNYNFLDTCTQWYKEELHNYVCMDEYGNTSFMPSWGESTFLARSGFSARRHRVSSVVPRMEEILEACLLELVKDGADGFQIDKLCVGSGLDFNPLNTEKPDVANCEGLVRAIERLLKKCRAINPDFCIASEAGQDRLIPFVDVYYRNSAGKMITPLRYVFPEWTSCQHLGSEPLDFVTVNYAIMTGSVIDVEPKCYQGSMDAPIMRKLSSYIMEAERIRNELKDIIFLGEYCDDLYATVRQAAVDTGKESKAAAVELRGEVMVPGGGMVTGDTCPEGIHYRVHKSLDGEQIALVIVNSEYEDTSYTYQFDAPYGQEAVLYSPFAQPRKVTAGQSLEIAGAGLHILVANR